MLSVHTSPLAALGGEKTGGMNVYVREFSRELARQGIQVDIFTRAQSADQPLIQPDVVHGVRVIHISAGPRQPLPVDELPQYVDEFTQGVLRFAADQGLRYGLIHAHYWLSGLVGEQLRAEWRTPLVQMFHTLGHMKNRIARSERERAAPARLAGEAHVVHVADQLVAATPAEERELSDFYEAAAHKITILPPGVDTTRFYPIAKTLAKDALGMPRGRVNLLFAGRIEPLKGIDALLQAIALIQHYRPEVIAQSSVTIVGGDPWAAKRDPEMVRLQELRCQLNLCDVVEFVGAKTQDELPWHYAAADMVVMPSHYESFGMVALEAMAMGTPVIATEVGGLAHLVQHGQTGFLVAPRDPEGLAARIFELLTNDEFRHRLGQQASTHARQYSWPTVVQQMQEQVYAPLCNGVAESQK